jgi:Tetratricopeptide repeat
MEAPIDDLVSRWRDNPTPTMTVALCEALRGSSSSLVEQVGQFATQRHSSDVAVLVSVARMYLDSNHFAEAQTVLVTAGKQAPHDGDIYRWLGETLLRRGDADRAEKVLKRAIQLGATGPDARVWLERARVFRPMQAKAGARAVAAEVAHTSEPARELLDSMSETTTDVHLPRPQSLARPAPVQSTEHRPFSKSAQTYPKSFDPPADGLFAKASLTAATPSPSRLPASSSSGGIDISVSAVAPLPTAPVPKANARSARPLPATNGAAPKAVPSTDGFVPHPRDVLDALTFAGIFEPQAAGAARPAAWDKPGQGPKRRGSGALIAGMVLFVAGSIGTYVFYQHKRAQDHLQSDALLVTVEAQLHAAKPDTLPQMEQELAQALQLESRSPRAALDWTQDRAMIGLIKSGDDVAFEDAMARAKDVGVPEEKYAFARVASFLFQGDTAGAAAVLPHWDGPAASDPWYQLVAGAALERAGDSRARDR